MPKSILVTGGTVFVSKYVAQYFAAKSDRVYVLNRNTRPQPEQTILIEADRHQLGNQLKNYHFDAVIDVTAYTRADIAALCDALGEFGQYIMISSSAVYPEGNPQPFTEEQAVGPNCFWGKYGTDKIEAEQELQKRVPDSYILRPPYLYGPMNDVYRESFVFDCARLGRKFYLPRDGELQLQFFYIEDLCKCIDGILEQKPKERIYNVGNPDIITVKDWVKLCYEIAGRPCELVPVHKDIEQREYFSFYDYEYQLDVSKQKILLSKTKPLKDGLTEAYLWYEAHVNEIGRKPYIQYIDANLI